MKILFYGSNGWIGKQFINYLQKQNSLIEIIPGVARIDDTDGMMIEIDREMPTHVVTFTGRTSGPGTPNIDYLEGKLIENIRDNLFGPVSLALYCQQRKIHLTYLGTGCIFEYDTVHTIKYNPFTEDDVPNFFGSSYSVVKGFTDRLFHQLPVLNLRIRMPITASDNPRNFISKILRYEKICSVPNSMTVLPTFFPIFHDLIACKTVGTFNCVNPGLISHNEILQMYQEIVDSKFTWKNFSVQDQRKILAAGRSNNWLSTETLESRYNLPTIHDAVKYVFQNWKTD